MDYLRILPPLSHKSKKGENSLNLNSVVLIKDQKKPRLVWSMGRVTKLFKGIDGKVRAVQLKQKRVFLSALSITFASLKILIRMKPPLPPTTYKVRIHLVLRQPKK